MLNKMEQKPRGLGKNDPLLKKKKEKKITQSTLSKKILFWEGHCNLGLLMYEVTDYEKFMLHLEN